MTHILIEALLVGISTVIIGFPISTLFMFLFNKNFSFKNYKFWWQIVLAYFLTGFMIHLIYEITGLNKKYCESKK